MDMLKVRKKPLLFSGCADKKGNILVAFRYKRMEDLVSLKEASLIFTDFKEMNVTIICLN